MKNTKIAIIGLGYVGLPLAVAFAEKYRVIGFDINIDRISQLSSGMDLTLEIDSNTLNRLINLHNESQFGLYLTSETKQLSECNIFIVTVPTPTDKYNRPVLTPMVKATATIANVLKKGDIVIYESTVYPGVTEDEMVPILESISGLKFNVDFFCGYSPERINPGDKEHTVTKIRKVTSGSTEAVAEIVDQLYNSIITAGTHKASSIRVAEAAKVIENSQRDINIAFVNELSKIFNLLNIDTSEVLEAAGTKWNFLKFRPGLVGGHCIGVDPYYLAQKAQEVGYHPEIILAGRRVNDNMGKYVAEQIIKLMIKKDIKIKRARLLILGFTFKEDCPDFRNTKVIDIINELIQYGVDLTIVDPWVDPVLVMSEYHIKSYRTIPDGKYDGIILAVAHERFKNINILSYKSENSIIYDVKNFLPKDIVDGRL